MSASCTISVGAVCVALATAASAQTAGTSVPASLPTAEPGGAVQPVMDREIYAHVLFNELEGRLNGGNTEFRWDGQGWVGSDYDKLWIKSEGTLQGNGTLEDGQQQFLFSRAITTYFDLQGGLRSDLDSHPSRNWAAFGIQGLAPYFFELEFTGFVSGDGHLAAKLEGSYDLLITQRLILQPQIEVNLYSKADPARAVGAGLSDIDTGLRLRYEFDRKFAPYIGVVYEGKFGPTASLARQAGESNGEVRFVFGVRVWF
jgi:copper resistance protein B